MSVIQKQYRVAGWYIARKIWKNLKAVRENSSSKEFKI